MEGIADKVYQIPYPAAGTQTLLSRIEYIHAIEKIDVIIPNFDAELYNFIKISPQLKDLGIETQYVSRKRSDTILDYDQVKEVINWALELEETSVIITDWPCVLKKRYTEDDMDIYKDLWQTKESK